MIYGEQEMNMNKIKKRKIKRKFIEELEDIPIIFSLFLVIAGFFIGSVFTFGMNHWYGKVQRYDALDVSACFESYDISYGKTGINEIILEFEDHDSLSVDGCCVSDEVESAIRNIPKGAKLDMLVHPNSNTVLELKCGEDGILSFEESQKDFKRQNIGFEFFGVFLYFAALMGVFSLILKIVRKQKLKKEKTK